MNRKEIMVPDNMVHLSLQEQLDLGKKMAEGDTSAREKLVLCCVPLVKSFMQTPLCKHFSSREDMFQDGILGTLEAVGNYDYKKNVMFTTFAFHYIHKRILKGIIAQAPVKISDRDFFDSVLLNATVDTFSAAHHVPPTDEQLSKLTSIPVNKVKMLQARNVNNMVVSLNDTIPGYNILALPDEDVCFVVEKVLKESAQKRIIAEALACLSDGEREIVIRRLMCKDKKPTLKQLADSQNICIAAVAKREKSAIKKLLAYFISHNVGFDDLVY